MTNDGLVWTRRGRIVRNTAATVLFLVVWSWLMRVSLPEQCRDVPVQEMSDGCLDIVLQ